MDGVAGTLSDGQLLRRYGRERCDAAFRQLVARHVDWIYSSAVRQVRDAHLAEDITQAVFLLLARKAAAFDERVVLSAWLFRALRYVASDAVKARRRRKHHERELGAVMSSTRRPDAGQTPQGQAWEQIAPVLDAAIGRLGARDRTAILLRFYERKTHAQVGAAMSVSEDAAKVRVSRAVDKLRVELIRRGVTLPAAALASAISGHAIQAAPAHVGTAAASLATGSGAAAGAGASSAAGTLSWKKGLVLAMTVGKTSAVVITCAILGMIVVGTVVYWSATPQITQSDAPSAAIVRQPVEQDFREAYALPDGQALRRVGPPFPSARRDFVERSLRPGMHPAMLEKEGPTSIVLDWHDGDPADLRCRMFQNNVRPDVGFVLQGVLGGRMWDFDVPPELRARPVEGDWVVRASASPTERAAVLQRALAAQLGTGLRIERRRVNAEVIVVSGSATRSGSVIQVYSDKMTKGRPASEGDEGDFAQFMEVISLVTGKRVVNESSVPPKTKFRTALHTSGIVGQMAPKRAVAKTDLILRNLSAQTGLTITRATRPVELWVVRTTGGAS